MTYTSRRAARDEAREMSDKHTPGPWVLDGPDTAHVTSSDDGYHCISGAGEDSPIFLAGFMLDADAYLIVAAPDLLGAAVALEDAEAYHANCLECEGELIPEACPACFPHFDKARLLRRAAIARATGAA